MLDVCRADKVKYYTKECPGRLEEETQTYTPSIQPDIAQTNPFAACSCYWLRVSTSITANIANICAVMTANTGAALLLYVLIQSLFHKLLVAVEQ